MKASYKREDFTYSANKGGYTIFYKGKSIGGAGTISNGSNIRGRAVAKQVHDYSEMAKNDILCIISGISGRYAKAIEEIERN